MLNQHVQLVFHNPHFLKKKNYVTECQIFLIKSQFVVK